MRKYFFFTIALIISFNSKSQTSKAYRTYGYITVDTTTQIEYFSMATESGFYVKTDTKKITYSLSEDIYSTSIVKKIREPNTTTYLGEDFSYYTFNNKTYDAIVFQTQTTFYVFFLIKKIPYTDLEKKKLNKDVRNDYHYLKLQKY